MSEEDRLRDRARGLLSSVFGHRTFQGFQEDVVAELGAGRDVVVLMPTGSGKSICYQIPALMREGTAIVVSPLIALMEDQVQALARRGVRATCIHSLLEKKEREGRQRRLAAGDLDLVYVTPERFRKPAFREALAGLTVALLAVDEAHCVSSWGHDFRPEYSRLGRVRDGLGRPPTIALTATATADTLRDLQKTLGLEEARVFRAAMDRPNLSLSVRTIDDDEDLVARVAAVIEGVGPPGIVYMCLIKDLLRLEDELRRRGLETLVYHGDLSTSERRDMQARFISGAPAVVLATNAFGMGVDKPDVRFILHGQIPGSLESYWQEIGRAGRDGKPSLCELLYRSEDLLIQKQFIEWANPAPDLARAVHDLMTSWGENLYAHDADEIRDTLITRNRGDGRVETILGLMRSADIIEGDFEDGSLRLLRPLEPGEERLLVDVEKRRRDLARLLAMVEYARSSDCRRSAVARWFGVETGDRCGNCDCCRAAFDDLGEFRSTEREEATERPANRSADRWPDRGDWIRIGSERGSLFRVLKVHRRGKACTAEVESGEDMSRRTVDLHRVRWHRLV